MILQQLRMIFSGVRHHAGFKLACHVAVGVWITIFYCGPQRWPLLPAHPAPTLALDSWVSFQPDWAFVYQSVFILHTLALWLPFERGAVKRYALGIAIAFLIGAVFFWFYPTLSPRPKIIHSWLHASLIAAVDGERNAFPSLHATMGLLAIVSVGLHVIRCGASRWWLVALAAYWPLLLYSTLATRQHRLLDLAAGAFLGAALLVLGKICHRATNRYEPLSSLSSPAARI